MAQREENGVRVHRSWLRVRPGEGFLDKALYEGSFAARLAPRVLSRITRADVVVCVVPTLLSAALGALAARATRTRLVVWVQDLVLDAARSVDGVGSGQVRALDAMRAVEGRAVRSADRVVSCSPGFVPYLLERGCDRARLETIPNWVDVDRFAQAPEPPSGRPFASSTPGNIGYTQGFETLFTAAELAGDGIEVEIVGGGNYADSARRLATGRCVCSRPSHATPTPTFSRPPTRWSCSNVTSRRT